MSTIYLNLTGAILFLTLLQFSILNPDLIPPLASFYGPFSSTHINLLVPFWELEQAPASWVNMCNFIDYFLAPSRFVEKALQALFTKRRILYYQQSYQLPSGIKPDRKRFDIPSEKTVFFQSFNIASDIVRKNPVASINAFYRAFQENPQVLFVLNVNVTNNNKSFIDALSKLKAYVSALKTIKIIDLKLDYADVLSLCASCDILISLHRAEGFGLSLIEAMAMGKAVITTAYSGNMDFVNTNNACLVQYKLIPAVSPFNPNLSPELLGFDPFWADPDVDQAASWMSMLHENESFRVSIQKKAQDTIRSFLEISRKASVFHLIKEIVNQLGNTI